MTKQYRRYNTEISNTIKLHILWGVAKCR